MPRGRSKTRRHGARGVHGHFHRVLRVFAAKDGSRVADYELGSEPAWNGAAVAYGKLFLALKNGKLLCFGQ